ncbi:cytochrome P450 [Dentipellis sp. KUC8613]|nr:cytochrome P450 [Dentipellis sp. KUC8613]
MATLPFTILDYVAALLFLIVLKQYADKQGSRRGLSYPPGPKGFPVIGNVLDMPTVKPWVTYAQWAKRYGDVVSVTALGQVIVIVNSAKAAKDFFERRGTVYMNRPKIPMFELMGWDVSIALMQYSEGWRVGRRLIDHSLRPQAAALYKPLQIEKKNALLKRLLETPEDLKEHVKHFTAAIVMSLTYGYDVKESNDVFVSLADQVNGLAAESILPGASLVNEFPFLRHFPEWLPGMGFKHRARYIYGLVQEMINAPFEYTKESLNKGIDRPSIVRECLNFYQDSEATKQDEEAMKRVAVAVYAAGADTTVASILSFFLLLLLRPEVKARAQAELDAVVGRERLPNFNDRPKMPYIDAICKELGRWKLVAPLGLPHAAAEDGVYEGYYIPKGAVLFANSWAILHDPEIYPDPESFKPERFLTSDGKLKEDPLLNCQFGFGRRICPGRHLVDSNLWLVLASVLAVFDVVKAKDSDGNDIPVEEAYTDHLVSHPKDFKCAILPRSEKARQLILAANLHHSARDEA